MRLACQVNDNMRALEGGTPIGFSIPQIGPRGSRESADAEARLSQGPLEVRSQEAVGTGDSYEAAIVRVRVLSLTPVFQPAGH